MLKPHYGTGLSVKINAQTVFEISSSSHKAFKVSCWLQS
jgi:hypothetical protein